MPSINTTKDARFLTLSIPRDNDKGPLVMEQVLSSLHGLNETVSFEIWSRKGKIRFACRCGDKEPIRFLLENHYPGIEVREETDEAEKLHGKKIFIAHLSLSAAPIFPIRRYSQTADYIKKEWVNPYHAILAPLRNIRNGEVKAIQMIVAPVFDWRKKGMETLAIYDAISPWWVCRRWWGLKDWIVEASYYCWFVRMFFLLITWRVARHGNERAQQKGTIDHRGHGRESGYEAARSKLSQAGFEVTIRFLYSGKHANANKTIAELAGSFAQFNIDEFNGFKLKPVSNSSRSSTMIRERKKATPMILSVEELAGILTLPDQAVKVPELERTSCRSMEPIGDFEGGIIIGRSVAGNRPVRVPLKNFLRHSVILGRTGSGKTTFALNLIRELTSQGKGVGVVDPHGDLLDEVLRMIPKERIKDAVLIDPTDTDYPIAFNPLKTSGSKEQIASALVDSMKKIFEESWGPRTDYILSHAVSTAIGSQEETFFCIPKILLDEKYRQKILKNLTDPVALSFWREEYKAMPARLRLESIAPILNKVNRFLMTPTMRNILGQRENRIDFRKIIDSRQLLLINLAKGKLGEENSSLLGNFLLAHIQTAALSRAEIAHKKRPDFYLIVDELQHFLGRSTNAVSTILTEGRKYRIGLIGLCQHIAQLGKIAETFLGNVSTTVSFGVGPRDAKLIAEYFREIGYEDVLNLPLYHAYLRVVIDNRPKIISLKNIPPVVDSDDCSSAEKVRKHSRLKYARSKQQVEEEITELFHREISIP